MRTRVKICCMADTDEAATAVAHGADALGLVGAMPSGPGVVTDATAAEIAAATPPPVATFLLTAETTAAGIADHVERVGATAVQIVSHIAPAESARLAALLPRTRRVQVVHVEGGGALDMIAAHAPHVDAFLLDSGRPSAEVPELGGTGRVHDWRVSQQFVAASPRPVFLAGGLTPGNAAEAIRTVRPYGLDLCTGVRTEDRLDAGKLAAFMDAVAAADSALA